MIQIVMTCDGCRETRVAHYGEHTPEHMLEFHRWTKEVIGRRVYHFCPQCRRLSRPWEGLVPVEEPVS